MNTSSNPPFDRDERPSSYTLSTPSGNQEYVFWHDSGRLFRAFPASRGNTPSAIEITHPETKEELLTSIFQSPLQYR